VDYNVPNANTGKFLMNPKSAKSSLIGAEVISPRIIFVEIPG
jgi:hypothetical protein